MLEELLLNCGLCITGLGDNVNDVVNRLNHSIDLASEAVERYAEAMFRAIDSINPLDMINPFSDGILPAIPQLEIIRVEQMHLNREATRNYGGLIVIDYWG